MLLTQHIIVVMLKRMILVNKRIVGPDVVFLFVPLGCRRRGRDIAAFGRTRCSECWRTVCTTQRYTD